MKNLTKFFIMMAVLCAITACSQAFEDVSNNKKKQETTKGRLVMKVGSKSRTILPDISIVESDIKTARLTANGTTLKISNGSSLFFFFNRNFLKIEFFFTINFSFPKNRKPP